MEDPYSGLLLEMDQRAQKAQPAGWCTGTVLGAGMNYISVRANGMTLEREDLRLDSRLVRITEDGTEVLLSAGAQVVLLPDADGEIYYLLCTVVEVKKQ